MSTETYSSSSFFFFSSFILFSVAIFVSSIYLLPFLAHQEEEEEEEKELVLVWCFIISPFKKFIFIFILHSNFFAECILCILISSFIRVVCCVCMYIFCHTPYSSLFTLEYTLLTAHTETKSGMDG